jgi:hypothetical protein
VVQGKYFSHTGTLSTICAEGVDRKIYQNLVHYGRVGVSEKWFHGELKLQFDVFAIRGKIP